MEKLDRKSLDIVAHIKLTLAGKKVYVVGSGSLIICLDKEITLETVEEIAKLKEKYGSDDMMRVVFRDNGFKDAEVKTNAMQILKQYGVGDVKSL
jgi:adenine-specific DNA-methyltransferase